jgi:hypothetical protein
MEASGLRPVHRLKSVRRLKVCPTSIFAASDGSNPV